MHHPFWPKKETRADLHCSIDSGQSDLTEEIFAQVDRQSSKKDSLSNMSGSAYAGAHQQDSTQDESSFASQARSDLVNSAEKKQQIASPFKPYMAAPIFSPFVDTNSAPVFKPNSFVFNPAPVQQQQQPQPAKPMQMAPAFNMSDYGASTHASSCQNRSDCSAEVIPHPYGGQKARAAGAVRSELPASVAAQLTTEEHDIIK